MSTDLESYLNYMSTWDGESDDNINAIITEHTEFVGLSNFTSDPAVDSEFGTLVDMATTLRDQTIAADATQMAADAAAVASIWSFGFGMIAFAALEATALIEKGFVSDQSAALNTKLTTVDTDISGQIDSTVDSYVKQYKANNTMIAAKGTIGLDTRTCRSFLLQFLAGVQQYNGSIDTASFKKYAEVARMLYNSDQVNTIYNALDQFVLSNQTDADIQAFYGSIKGLNLPSTTLALVLFSSTAIMVYKLNIASNALQEQAEIAGIDPADLDVSVFDMLDAVGKVFVVLTVLFSVVDIVLSIIDIVDVVQQTSKMCDQLNGDIKTNYKAYFNGIRTASQQYNAAVAAKAQKT